MKTLDQLTQSHLSVLILDKDSHNPIVRMPIYAEFSIVEEAPPYKISREDLGAIAANSDFFGSETVGAALRASLAQHIEENTFRGLSEENKQAFLERVINLLEDERGLFSKPESEIRDIVDRAILKAMEEFEIPQSQTPSKKSIYSYPLGYLATDHVGYASFDLTRISDLTRSRNSNLVAFDQNRTQTSYAFFVYPMGKEGARFDALEQGRFTNEAVFAKLSIEQPTLTRDLKILNLPSMQKPSLIDWYFSPGSFAAHPEFLVGDDGCERLFPAQIALQEFNIRQVVRIVGQSPIPVPEGFKLAYVDDYRVTWQSLGHSLGEILYSLPLAPGESVKLAVIDWSWESTTQRTEKTSLTEEILHQTHRDRTISETVKAGLREFQHGSSFMGGIAGSAGASGSTGVVGGAAGIAGSLGGSTATSEGSRDLVGENVQRLSDSFSQASSAQREINSTVVIQSRQEEKESIQTRTFTNYNHSHTLTVLYYEILRHFKVEVAWVRRRLAVLVKMSQEQLTRTFTANQLLGLRYLIDPFLLDPKLKDALDAASRVALSEEKLKRETNKWSASTQTIDPGAKTFVKLIAQFTTTGDDTSEPVFVVLVLHDGRTLEFQCDGAGDEGISPEFEKPLPFPINWNQIRGVDVRLKDINSGGDWEESNILITMVTAANERMSILADGATRTIDDAGGSTGVLSTLQPPPPTTTNVGQKPQRVDFISAEDDLAVQSLLAHFQANRSYYNRILMLAANSNSIAIEFESKAWSSGQVMADHVDSTPLETFGSYIAYPFLDANEQLAELNLKDLKKSAEKLITLPTRGVFAEGKLGHCNISEEIDNTRFWKWEEHPIPFEAPGINPVTPVTPQPQQTNTTPTPFPSSLVNIVNPSPAPDPTGLAAALTLLGTPNIFRDMSGQQEVADLLKKLSDNTISITEASNRATEIQKKYGSSTGANSSGSSKGVTAGGNISSGTGTGAVSKTDATGAEMAQRTQNLKDMVGYANPSTLRGEFGNLARKQSIFEQNAIASNDPAFVPGALKDFREFYKQYLDQQYPNKNPLDDNPYTRNRDFYTLKAYEKAFGQKDDSWNPELGFKPNERIIRRLYDYYQATYKSKPDKLLWAGLGRLAGGAVLSGLLTPGLPDPSFLSATMVLIGKAIFLDLAWQHEMFLVDPQRTIDMAREHDARFPAKAKYEIAWRRIASDTPAEVADGNRMLLENEQFTIIQPLYDKIKQSSDRFPFSKTNAFTLNVHPYHLPFIESFPSTRNADVTVANDRWEWITNRDGMWDKWIRIPTDERSRLVDLSMDDLLMKRWGSVKPEFLPPGV